MAALRFGGRRVVVECAGVIAPAEPTPLKSTDVTRPFVRGSETSAKAAPTESESADEAMRRGAHRLHTGAYPVVAEPVSMRPRNEPPPEPAELFRPAGRDDKRPDPGRPANPEATLKVAAVKPAERV